MLTIVCNFKKVLPVLTKYQCSCKQEIKVTGTFEIFVNNTNLTFLYKIDVKVS